MDGLREDMCFYGLDKFITVTTAIPGFIRTNDDYFDKIISKFHDYLINPSEPELVAEKIVDGILKNYENVHVSKHEIFSAWICNTLPREVKTQCFKNAMKIETRDEFFKTKLKQCKLLENDEIIF